MAGESNYKMAAFITNLEDEMTKHQIEHITLDDMFAIAEALGTYSLRDTPAVLSRLRTDLSLDEKQRLTRYLLGE